MKAQKWQYGTIGSVSCATMRKEDLIPSFTSELRYLGHRSKALSRIERDMNRKDYYESEDSDYDLSILFDMLDAHALPYMYFGAHPDDGSDYGFWVSEGLGYDFDGLKVEDLAEVPAGYVGEILLINDRGNMTFYNKTARKLHEIWAVV